MPSVVIIHATEDAMPARALAVKLRGVRLSPVFEQSGDALRQALSEAAVTLVLWSPRSVNDPSLVHDVAFAQSRGPVVHARMQNAEPPEHFRGAPSFDLTGWRGEDDFQGWIDLASAVASRAGVSPPPPPPRATSDAPFFRPGAPAAASPAAEALQGAQRARPAPPRVQIVTPQPPPPPPPRAEPRPETWEQAPPPQRRQEPAPEFSGRANHSPLPEIVLDDRRGGLPVVPILIALLVIGLGAGGYFYLNGARSGDALATAWEETPRNDAAAMRAFLEGEPGRFRAAAQQALVELEEQSFDAAQEEDSIEGFEAFLNDFPDSDHAIEARGRIAELRIQPDDEAPTEPAPDELALDPSLALPEELQPSIDPALPNGAAPGGPVTLTPPPAPEPTPEELPEPAGAFDPGPAADEPLPQGPTN